MTDEQNKFNITPEEIESGKTMAFVSYLVFWLPFIIEESRKNKFVMYHTQQSIVIAIAYAIASVVGVITCGIGMVLYIPILVFHIMGIVNAFQGAVKPLPLIGPLAEKFNLVK